ncbi:hypothetical protein J2S25_001729 [Mesobacillus stamsii]|uniref:Oxaloacetate decarboxylase n=1 Tax=Mesobacillus stamsii TaxID=225347 RepID=A0ABU0FUC2_9BACI|nr:hypothetical protein [Mesobacillus stamsii]
MLSNINWPVILIMLGIMALVIFTIVFAIVKLISIFSQKK